jgi:DNA helicase II / ATP-dependent DNA helicase PcrA
MSEDKYGLNDEQWAAVIAESPTIVNASAGSGKTRCLTAKIRYLLDAGAQPRNILAITFTNKAANEMKERIKVFCPYVTAMQVSTIHSMAVRIIKVFPQHTPLKIPFSIYDDNDQLTIMKAITKARGITEDPAEILSLISKAKSEDTVDKDFEDIQKVYQDILIKNNACDFDDLLLYARDCLKHDDCKTHYSNLWQHVLVDEFQDTSIVQYEIVTLIHDSQKTKTLFVVGDANQSIYGWRSAKPENMENFIDKYKPSVQYLTYNYRSSPEIISHANEYLQFGKPMVAKAPTKGVVAMAYFSSQEEEADKIADALQRVGNYPESVIIYRTNSRSLLFERALAIRKVPYKVVGDIPFYKRRVSKDLLSYCKAAVNHQDMESLIRSVNTPKRGFGAAKQEKLLNEGWDYLHGMADSMPSIQSFVKILDEIKHKRPLQAIEDVLFATGYRDTLETDSDRQMLATFLNVSAGFNTIDELILTSNFLEEDSGHGVRLMSAHASKGLEFDRVFVVGVEEGIWPHALAEDVDEERRLYYVACTRAKKYLNISYSKTKLYRNTVIPMSPSPLFEESLKNLAKNRV